jgi:hypothetical protein
MESRLIVLTKSPKSDPFTWEIVEGEGEAGVRIFDLTKGESDYKELLLAIFTADTVHIL